ncbi:MAG TPA: hypothetical protein VD971_09635 [Phycisphaerales bacterium]|nr:hypothetical protein [Phycisphaerales bacterium]
MERPAFDSSRARRWPASALGETALRVTGSFVRGTLAAASALRELGVEAGIGVDNHDDEERTKAWLEGVRWPRRPLQVGIVNPGHWAGPLFAAGGVLDVEWHSLPEHGRLPASLADHLDAVVASPTPWTIEVLVSERRGRDAAWYDWANERPLSYPSVFPARIDPSRVTLDFSVVGDRFHPELARRVIECACAAGRHATRLSLRDRLAGRAPMLGVGDSARCMTALAETVAGFDPAETRIPAVRTAARVLSAWAVGAPALADETRANVMAAVLPVLGDEPETLLRAAAVRIGATDDGPGFGTLERAAGVLRGKRIDAPADQWMFLQSELAAQASEPAAIGRVAAGVVLLGATCPPGSYPYFRDDFFDEVRATGALLEKEQDLAVLMEASRIVERVHGVAPREVMLDARALRKWALVREGGERVPAAPKRRAKPAAARPPQKRGPSAAAGSPQERDAGTKPATRRRKRAA